jgi:hypothetical protein
MLIFIPLVFYLLWTYQGITDVDPCSATPGYNYGSGLKFPFVAGALLYWCLLGYAVTNIGKFLISGLLPSIILAVSAFFVTYFLYHIETVLNDTMLWNFIYDASQSSK